MSIHSIYSMIPVSSPRQPKKGIFFSPSYIITIASIFHKTELLVGLFDLRDDLLLDVLGLRLHSKNPSNPSFISALFSGSRTELLPICFSRLLRSKDSAVGKKIEVKNHRFQTEDPENLRRHSWNISKCKANLIAFFLSASISFCN